jgi:hypothetical protein
LSELGIVVEAACLNPLPNRKSNFTLTHGKRFERAAGVVVNTPRQRRKVTDVPVDIAKQSYDHGLMVVIE